MKISLNWLKEYVEVPVSDDELIRLIGARLVEVEGVIDETEKYNNIYVVRVVKAEKIPETHLTLCQIDYGASELVQVVCGAPNVREGMLTVWIKPGAIVPASVHEDAPFVIGARKMRGYESNGMLAGADELDFGDDHSGIVEIDPSTAQPGQLIADIFGLDDKILEIENKSLTHRPDCFGVIGFAREVAGILGEKFDTDFRQGFSRDASSRPSLRGSSLTRSPLVAKALEKSCLKISIANSGICQRYSALVLEKHGELKKKYLTWQDTILSKSGMRPVDPIVDATNYLMLLTGQPLHAFDYDKFVKIGGGKKPEIRVRLAKKDEKLMLLDGKEIELNENDIVICSGDIPVALAGAMGGESTMIDENTRNIILESATFSLYNLRKTQMAHGIFSEAITRFTKGQPPYQTLAVAEDCAELLSEGFVISDMADEYPESGKRNVVKITTDEINGLLGTNYNEGLVTKTLENVGFEIKRKRGELEILAPEWRTDIHIKEDIIEEVGRLLGYDNIEPVLPRHLTAEPNKMFKLKSEIRETMKSFGANEVLTYSFVSEKLLERAGLDVKNSYRIVNSISPELQIIRQTIVPSLLEKAYINQKVPFDKFALYEMNKVYQKTLGMDEENVPVERMQIGFVLAERKGTGAAYYKARHFAEGLLGKFNIEAEFLPLKNKTPMSLPFENKRAAEIWVNDKCIGVVGEFKNSVRRNFKLAEYLAGFEMDMDMILESCAAKKIAADFGIREKIDETITTKESYSETLKKVHEKYPEAKITPVGIYQPNGVETKNITFHIEK